MVESEYGPSSSRLATSRMSRRGFCGCCRHDGGGDDARRNACGVLRVGREVFRGRRGRCTGRHRLQPTGTRCSLRPRDRRSPGTATAATRRATPGSSTVLAPALKDKYDITLDLVGMDINDILTQLSGEMQAGVDGRLHRLHLDQRRELLLRARRTAICGAPSRATCRTSTTTSTRKAPRWLYDFGSATEGYECPYGKAQMQMWVDNGRRRRGPADRPPKSSRRSAKPIPVR